MLIRERSESMEEDTLSNRAAMSRSSIGRIIAEPLCEVRTEYQRDRDRILHSKSFRRLKHKTQVFLSPEGDHYRTRLTHTLEVSQIARTVARALRLNEDLTEAIALGHDLGHTPFGHAGEMELDLIHPGGFHHNEQSLRVVEELEDRKTGKRGLNLTMEVRDGILNHRGVGIPKTLEGQIVKICDRVAYINHDIDDAIRAQVLNKEQIPADFFEALGYSHSERINLLILDLIHNSMESDSIRFSQETESVFLSLRDFMFREVYLNDKAKKEEEKARHIINALYHHFASHPESMPEEYAAWYQEGQGIAAVKDYIAGMTDRYAVGLYQELFVPKFWRGYSAGEK